MKPATTRMSRLVIDLPARVALRELHDLAARYGCRVYRRPDGSLVLRPSREGA